MMRPSEIRVWSLSCPSRASRGSVRTVSTANVRIDLLAPTTASAAPRASASAAPETSPMPCASRELNATPLSVYSAG